MSEETRMTPSAQEELLRRLKAIGVDLWGGMPETVPAEESAKEEETLESDIEKAWRKELPESSKAAARILEREKAPLKTEKPAQSGGASAKPPKATLENLWVTADETVDWTKALLSETSRDGLTGPKLWSFYHRMAPKVLAGDTGAYAEVLTTINPLGDLTEYVAGMILRTPGPDRLECVFECQKDDLEKYGRDYLGALSLRIARDLLAILPVTEVQVTGNLEGQEKLKVLFRRDQLLKRKMAFLVPADFVEACGGSITAG